MVAVLIFFFFYVEGMRGSQRTYIVFEKTDDCPFYELSSGRILAIPVNCFSLWHLCYQEVMQRLKIQNFV